MDSIKLQQIDSNSDKAIITKIHIKSGDYVAKNDTLFDVETAKTVDIIITEIEGYIDVICEELSEYNIGDELAKIYSSKEEFDHFIHVAKMVLNNNNSLNATQKAINKAKELAIDINLIKKDGIINESDVIKFIGKNLEITNKKPIFKYDRERVVIIGAGMGADVVCDILLDDNNKVIVGLVDDNVKEYNFIPLPILNSKIETFPNEIDKEFYDTVIISIVSGHKSLIFREKIFNEYSNQGIKFTNAIPKNIDIRRFTKIGTGNLICSDVYIGTCTIIGDNNFISYGCKIGHHNVIGNSNMIAPNVVTSGDVKIGNRCVFAACVTTMNRLSIGNDVILPVGFSVLKDYEDDVVVK
jgi:acetyltransferase-like isoleucine patch superfamily enzyme/glycine cleavage system H lipoate-binding protein